MKALLVSIATSVAVGLPLFASEKTTVKETIEHCTKVEAGPVSKETCRITDLESKETVQTEKVCNKTEIGVHVKAGPLKAGASTGGGTCTTKTTKESSD